MNWQDIANFILGGAVWGDVLRHLWNLALAFLLAFPIGWERERAARGAGVRTFPLVSLTSCGFVLVALSVLGRDPDAQSRVFQGLIPGIGFLGAGVIVREGVSVRGLTTAASIWITAAIGVLCGAGFYFPVILGTVLTLGTLSVFRWIEGRMPSLFYVHYSVRFAGGEPLPEGEFRALVRSHDFRVAEVGYHMNASAGYFEYRGVMRTLDKGNVRRFAETLRNNPAVVEFRLAPTSN